MSKPGNTGLQAFVAVLVFIAGILFLPVVGAADGEAAPSHGIAMHGEPKYGPGFRHFDYADPGAPKGGEARLHAIGTFDTLSGFTLKGVAVEGFGNI